MVNNLEFLLSKFYKLEFIDKKCEKLLYNIENLSYKSGSGRIDVPSHWQIKQNSELKFLSHPFDAALHSGRLAILPQDSELPLESTPEGFLSGLARLQGLSADAAKASVRKVLEAVNLADRAKASIRSLSHGMRKRLMAAQCFLGEPDLILLDEPMNGLDPEEAVRFRNLILSRRAGCTVVVSSHNLADLEKFCTHVTFVRDGKVVKTAALKDLTADGASLEDKYLVQFKA